MRITEAIVLAGGEGTRLKNAVPALPKCLAPVIGRPFIDYLISYLLSEGVAKFIFALGHQSDQVQEYLDNNWPGLDKVYAVEPFPLGTGGAINHAASFAKQQHVLIINGDTLFTAKLDAAALFHETTGAACTLLLKPLTNFNRFGTVQIDNEKRVTGFVEKQPCAAGLINAGVSLLDLQQWKAQNWPQEFSFESDYLQQEFNSVKMMGHVQDAYFIDIGIPEDYERAQTEFVSFL